MSPLLCFSFSSIPRFQNVLKPDSRVPMPNLLRRKIWSLHLSGRKQHGITVATDFDSTPEI